jgi:DNA-binding transcriptional LysR family regulator
VVLPICAPALPRPPRFAGGRRGARRPAAPATWKPAPGGAGSTGAGFLSAIGRPLPGRGEHGVTINNYPLVIQAALAGQGVALGWRPLVDDLLTSGQLAPAWGEAVRTERGYFLVHAKRRDGSPEVRLFRRWLQAEVSRAPA